MVLFPDSEAGDKQGPFGKVLKHALSECTHPLNDF